MDGQAQAEGFGWFSILIFTIHIHTHTHTHTHTDNCRFSPLAENDEVIGVAGRRPGGSLTRQGCGPPAGHQHQHQHQHRDVLFSIKTFGGKSRFTVCNSHKCATPFLMLP